MLMPLILSSYFFPIPANLCPCTNSSCKIFDFTLCPHTQQRIEHGINHVDIPACRIICILVHNHMFQLLVGRNADNSLPLILGKRHRLLFIFIQTLEHISSCRD